LEQRTANIRVVIGFVGARFGSKKRRLFRVKAVQMYAWLHNKAVRGMYE
jgi:hypothetical protein